MYVVVLVSTTDAQILNVVPQQEQQDPAQSFSDLIVDAPGSPSEDGVHGEALEEEQSIDGSLGEEKMEMTEEHPPSFDSPPWAQADNPMAKPPKPPSKADPFTEAAKAAVRSVEKKDWQKIKSEAAEKKESPPLKANLIKTSPPRPPPVNAHGPWTMSKDKNECTCAGASSKYGTCKQWFPYDKHTWCSVASACRGARHSANLGLWAPCSQPPHALLGRPAMIEASKTLKAPSHHAVNKVAEKIAEAIKHPNKAMQKLHLHPLADLKKAVKKEKKSADKAEMKVHPLSGLKRAVKKEADVAREAHPLAGLKKAVKKEKKSAKKAVKKEDEHLKKMKRELTLEKAVKKGKKAASKKKKKAHPMSALNAAAKNLKKAEIAAAKANAEKAAADKDVEKVEHPNKHPLAGLKKAVNKEAKSADKAVMKVHPLSELKKAVK